MHNQKYQKFKHELINFWLNKNCVYVSALDARMGAATMHPIMPEIVFTRQPNRAVFTQLCRRYDDVYVGSSDIRLGQYEQLQVVLTDFSNMKTPPYDLVVKSLGIDSNVNLVEFLEDNWKSPTMGAFGKGHELRVNGVELVQLTYFYLFANKRVSICLEITYGLERCYQATHHQPMPVAHLNTLSVPAMSFNKSMQLIKKQIKGIKPNAKNAYHDFMHLNDLFNQADSHGRLSKNCKTELMLSISKLFENIIEVKYFSENADRTRKSKVD